MPSSTGGRNRAIAFLVGSLLLAGVAVTLVMAVVRRSEARVEAATAPGQNVDVVVATRDLYMGLPITADDVSVRSLSKEQVPRDSTFATLEDLLGRTPRERILANEPIREERLARPDAGVGLNAIVTPGKRGMTIATDTETGIAGLLQSGNYIDVIVTIAPEDPSAVGAKWVTETILQGIKVLAVGSQITPDGRAPAPAADANASRTSSKTKADAAARKLKPSITLEVTPEEAEKLALAMSRGEIRVVLRSDIDILQIDSHGLTTADQLIGVAAEADPTPIRRRDAAPAAAATTTPPASSAEVIQGGPRSEVTFGAENPSRNTTRSGGR
jgi:pilus assembly protein CpaB